MIGLANYTVASRCPKRDTSSLTREQNETELWRCDDDDDPIVIKESLLSIGKLGLHYSLIYCRSADRRVERAAHDSSVSLIPYLYLFIGSLDIQYDKKWDKWGLALFLVIYSVSSDGIPHKSAY